MDHPENGEYRRELENNLHAMENYKNGELDGSRRIWSFNQMISEEWWENGKQTKKMVYREKDEDVYKEYTDGKISVTKTYLNDDINYREDIYDVGGQIVCTKYHSDDILGEENTEVTKAEMYIFHYINILRDSLFELHQKVDRLLSAQN